MSRVTVGVPVFNAESLLEQSLENLAAQTFRDFKVIVLDNASTDSTANIARRLEARDPRFTYHRQPHNKGALQNFADVLSMASTPYFMWRAYDDLSDISFIEETVRLLEGNPAAALAVGCVVSKKKKRQSVSRFPERSRYEPPLVYTIRLLFRSHPSWVYGLFRTEELKQSLANVRAGFPHVIASDHLTIFPFIVTGRVAGTNSVTFVQRFNERQPNSLRHPLRDPRAMNAVRFDFFRFCRNLLPALVNNPVRRVLLRPALWVYSGRAYRAPKIASAFLRTWFGEKPHADAFGTNHGEVPTEPANECDQNR